MRRAGNIGVILRCANECSSYLLFFTGCITFGNIPIKHIGSGDSILSPPWFALSTVMNHSNGDSRGRKRPVEVGEGPLALRLPLVPIRVSSESLGVPKSKPESRKNISNLDT